MEQTTVVNIRTSPYDIYIGRAGKGLSGYWGNPYQIGKDGTRDEVIQKYRSYLLRSPEMLSKLVELKGKRLGCFCAPSACHGDVLAEMANTLE